MKCLCVLIALCGSVVAAPPTPQVEHVKLAALRSQVNAWPVSQAGYRRALGPLTIAADPASPSGARDSLEQNGFFTLTSSLDLSQTIAAAVAGETQSVTLVAPPGQPALDLTGAMQAHIHDITLRGGLRLARRADGASAGNHRLDNVVVEGQTLIEASEGNVVTGCTFQATDVRPALTITNGPPKRLGYTMQTAWFFGGSYVNHAGGPAILIDNNAGVLTDIVFVGGNVAVSAATDCACEIRCGPGIRRIAFVGMRWETAAARNAIKVTGINTLIGLKLQDCTIYSEQSLLSASVPLDEAVIQDVECYALSPRDWAVGAGGAGILPASSGVASPGRWRPLIDAQLGGKSLVNLRSARLGAPFWDWAASPPRVLYPANCEVRP